MKKIALFAVKVVAIVYLICSFYFLFDSISFITPEGVNFFVDYDIVGVIISAVMMVLSIVLYVLSGRTSLTEEEKQLKKKMRQQDEIIRRRIHKDHLDHQAKALKRELEDRRKSLIRH